jgi:hypothetical protein
MKKKVIEKDLLNLNLNYAHRNLTNGFRVGGKILSLILFLTGINLLVNTNLLQSAHILSAVANIVVAVFALLLSNSYLPKSAKKYFKINNNGIFFKLFGFSSERNIPWDIIEQIEIKRDFLKFRIETEIDIVPVSLLTVSLNDFESLQKQLIEECNKRDIDII